LTAGDNVALSQVEPFVSIIFVLHVDEAFVGGHFEVDDLGGGVDQQTVLVLQNAGAAVGPHAQPEAQDAAVLAAQLQVVVVEVLLQAALVKATLLQEQLGLLARQVQFAHRIAFVQQVDLVVELVLIQYFV